MGHNEIFLKLTIPFSPENYPDARFFILPGDAEQRPTVITC
jgi:hypothetical protein